MTNLDLTKSQWLGVQSIEPFSDKFKSLPAQVRALRAFDSMIAGRQVCLPRLLTLESLREGIVTQKPNLKVSYGAVISGTGVLAKVALWVLMDLGYSEVRFINGDFNEFQVWSQDLSRMSLGVQLSFVEEEKMTQMSAEGSILVNTTVGDGSSQIFEDLSYLNFLQKDSLVANLVESEHEEILRSEAKLLGAQVYGYQEFHQGQMSRYQVALTEI
ncbi:MAG: hypothetical protein LW875_06475 [Proteobacteria bacterium]|nr:hypothetical protein [Pseudomonadota bacterium]